MSRSKAAERGLDTWRSTWDSCSSDLGICRTRGDWDSVDMVSIQDNVSIGVFLFSWWAEWLTDWDVYICESRCGVSACAWPLLPIIITTRKTVWSLPEVSSPSQDTTNQLVNMNASRVELGFSYAGNHTKYIYLCMVDRLKCPSNSRRRLVPGCYYYSYQLLRTSRTTVLIVPSSPFLLFL